MSANIQPIFTRTPQIEWGGSLLTAANTAKDGTGTVLTVFTADSVEGSYVLKLRARAAGTNAATVLRVFINNGSTNATPSNNILWDEMTLAITTISEVAALALYEMALGFALPAGYKLNVTIGTAASPGYYVSVLGGKY